MIFAVDELEVKFIVNMCKNKLSTDCDGCDMTLVKKKMMVFQSFEHIFAMYLS